MPEIKLQHIISVSSEEKQYPAENLLKNDSFKKWKCAAGEKQASVVFQFEKASEISQIDIGNEASAFVEVLVGKSSVKEEDYQVIVVASSFMNPAESRASQNPNRVRIFGSDQLSKAVAGQKWDRAKVVCTQPFNKMIQYGLSFIKFHSTAPTSSSGDASSLSAASDTKTTSFGAFKLKSDESASIRTGSLFEKNKPKVDAAAAVPATGPAAIRAASKMAEQVRVEKPPPPPAVTPSTSKPGTSESAAVSGSKAKMTATKDDNRTPSSPPPSKKTKQEAEVTGSSVQPVHVLMKKVVFVLSGFENPERSNLRDKALEMGASYKADWTKQCTHLICAFQNTPKYSQVLGKGRIVKKTWIMDCYAQKKLLPWRQYRLGRAKSPDGQKSSDEEDDKSTSSSAAAQKKTTSPAAGAGTGKTSSSSSSSTDCKNTSADSCDKKTACDKGLVKSETGASKNCSVQQKKDVDDSQQTDEDWDPFAEDIGIESDCDTEEEIRRFEEMQAKKASPTKPSSSETKPASQPNNKEPVPSTSRQAATKTIYDVSTDDDDDDAGNQLDEDGLPVLPDFFSGQMFLLNGKFSDRRTLVRYIIAYNGRMADYMGDDVKYVITDNSWDDTFDTALADNSGLIFVRPSWIHACHSAQKYLPYQKFAVVPP